jgi:hypothetical protein
MRSTVIGHSGLRQATLGRCIAVDAPLWPLMPADIECAQLGKEVQAAVGQVVVNPPRHRCPGAALFEVVDQPRHNDARHGTVRALRVGVIPDVATKVLLVAGAVEVVLVAVLIDLRCAVARPDVDAPEGSLQRFQQVLTQHPAGLCRTLRLVWHVAQPVPSGNFALQKIAHEEVFGQTNAAQFFKFLVGVDGGHFD